MKENMGMCHMQVPLKGEFKQLCKIEKITPDCKVELHPLMSSPSDLSCVTDGNRWKSEKRNANQETIDRSHLSLTYGRKERGSGHHLCRICCILKKKMLNIKIIILRLRFV